MSCQLYYSSGVAAERQVEAQRAQSLLGMWGGGTAQEHARKQTSMICRRCGTVQRYRAPLYYPLKIC